MTLMVFARIGWMRWYRGPQPDDEKLIGGGKYNKNALGHEAFNFLPLNGSMFGYFQPQLQTKHPSHIALQRIQSGFTGDVLKDVLTIFVATHPQHGGQRIVGWFRSSMVFRDEQASTLAARQSFPYFLKASEKDAFLVPYDRRDFAVPAGRGAFGRTNVCYVLESDGQLKKQAKWINDSLDYINSYSLENVIQDPASQTDAAIMETINSTLEHAAGFQSNPRIRKAIEDYAMAWANRYLSKLKYTPRDTHKNKPYDFVCEIGGTEVFVEVKGMQGPGKAISLTPREVQHAQTHQNSALFIVHSVHVKGRKKPIVSGGVPLFLNPWDLSAGTLEPRSYVFTVGG
jgi:hypothetical protein